MEQWVSPLYRLRPFAAIVRLIPVLLEKQFFELLQHTLPSMRIKMGRYFVNRAADFQAEMRFSVVSKDIFVGIFPICSIHICLLIVLGHAGG